MSPTPLDGSDQSARNAVEGGGEGGGGGGGERRGGEGKVGRNQGRQVLLARHGKHPCNRIEILRHHARIALFLRPFQQVAHVASIAR